MALLEKTIETQIKTYLKKRYGEKVYFFKTHGGPYQKKGVTDLVGCLGGYFFGLEVKRPGEKPTELQSKHILDITEAGGVAAVVTSIVEVGNVLKVIEMKINV